MCTFLCPQRQAMHRECVTELVGTGSDPPVCGLDAQATKNPADGIGSGGGRKRRPVAANEQGLRIRTTSVDEELTPVIDVAPQLSDQVVSHGHDPCASLSVADRQRAAFEIDIGHLEAHGFSKP